MKKKYVNVHVSPRGAIHVKESLFDIEQACKDFILQNQILILVPTSPSYRVKNGMLGWKRGGEGSQVNSLSLDGPKYQI